MSLKKSTVINVVVGSVFVLSLGCFVLRIIDAYSEKVYYPQEITSQLDDDDFDINLLRLNSMDKLVNYCDSLFNAPGNKTSFPEIGAEVLRQKFYHGYSYYTSGSNAVGVLLEPVVKNGAVAIVLPDDIVAFPNAACSQQSIVGMELFKRKGYPVRKVMMFDSVANTGHFAYEVYYEKGWHFFDTNQQPDLTVLAKYRRPSADFLAANPEIVAAAYHRKKDPQMFVRLIASHKLGPVDKFAAPNAFIYQKATKFFTSFGWALIWGFYFIRGLVRDRREKKLVAKAGGAKSEEIPEPDIAILRQADAV